MAGYDDGDGVGRAGAADRAHRARVAGLLRELAVGDDLAAVDLAVQGVEHGAAERAAGQRQVDRQAERVVVALEVRRERVAGGRELAVGAHEPRPDAGGDAGQRGVLGLALEGDPQHAARALDDEQRADRGLERRVDGVGEALLHGGGGQAVKELLGQGGHAVTRSRRVRTAVETRWRAASGEVPRSGGDAVVVEVLDEAQPQRVAGGGGKRGDQRLEARRRRTRPRPRAWAARRSGPRGGAGGAGRARSWS